MNQKIAVPIGIDVSKEPPTSFFRIFFLSLFSTNLQRGRPEMLAATRAKCPLLHLVGLYVNIL